MITNQANIEQRGNGVKVIISTIGQRGPKGPPGEATRFFDSVQDAVNADPVVHDDEIFETPEGLWRRDSSLPEGAEFIRAFPATEQQIADIGQSVDDLHNQVDVELAGIRSDNAAFQSAVNQDLQQITAEKQAFESEAQEIKDAVANMTTTGKIYDSLADAIAENPKPADGTPFSVMGDGDNDGYWKFDSSQPDGVKFGRKFDRRIQVESISQLRNYKGRSGEAVDVLGYYEDGDGGGGLFYWDNSSTEDDNGGTVIEANGVANGRWKRNFEGGVDVKWFGASLSLEDNSVIFNSIIERGFKLIYGDGLLYPISSRVVIEDKDGIELRGIGIKHSDSGSYDSLLIRNSNNIQIKGIEIEGSGHILDSDDNSELTDHGIHISRDCNRIVIDDAYIHDVGKDGIYINESTTYEGIDYPQNIIIKDSEITRVSRNAISVISGKKMLIKNCIFRDYDLCGVDVEPNSQNTICEDITVRNCDFYCKRQQVSGVQGRGTAAPEIGKRLFFIDNSFYETEDYPFAVIRVDFFPESQVVGNKFRNIGSTAISVRSDDCVVHSNIIEGSGEANHNPSDNKGAIGGSGDRVSIFNNNIKDVKVNGIYVSGVDIVVSGNNLKNIGKGNNLPAYGIYLNRAEGAVINGNTIISTTGNMDTGIKFRVGTIHAVNSHISNNVIKGALNENISSYYQSEQTAIYNNSKEGAIPEDLSIESLEVQGLSNQAGVYTYENEVLRITNPKGAVGYFPGDSQGAIKISLPRLWSRTQIEFSVILYNYSPVQRNIINISGYTDEGLWRSTSAVSLTSSDTIDFPVRFGDDGEVACVWIGDIDSEWTFLDVAVSYVKCSRGGRTAQLWAEGWSTSLVSAFDTIHETIESSFPISDASKIKNLYKNVPTAQGPNDAVNLLQLEERLNGATGSYTSQDGKTITVENGIITSITEPEPEPDPEE